ncbi:MAG: HlyD family efflux transporter periplasmic adaptor subunit [Terriglobales bacterium]
MPDRPRIENGTEEQVRQTEVAQEEARELWPEEAEAPSKRERARSYFRTHPRAKWVLLLVALVATGVGVSIWYYYSIRETTDDAQIDGHIAPVSARVGGTVTKVYVDDNEFVKAGQVLVQLDPKDYEVALQRAEAELADAEAAAHAASTGVPIAATTTSSSLSTARANLTAAHREVDAAKARLVEAEAHYRKAASDLKRAQQLIERDEISQQQYDAAHTTEAAARAAVDAARASVATAESHVLQAESQVRAAQTAPQQVAVTRARASAAQANVQTKRAAVEQAKLNLQYTTVRAPFAGIVSKRNVEPGQVVQAAQPLFAVVNLDDIWVTANFKETQLKDMRSGQSATVHVDAYGRDYKGFVDSIGGATGARFSLLPPENATGNYVKVVQRIPVKIVFAKGQDPNHLLRPGMSVVPTVVTK